MIMQAVQGHGAGFNRCAFSFTLQGRRLCGIIKWVFVSYFVEVHP